MSPSLVTMPKICDPKKLRAARKKKGWSVAEVEHETWKRGWKVARNTIVNLEQGRSGGTIETLGRLAEVYEVERIDDLLMQG